MSGTGTDKNANLRERLLALGFDVVRFARVESSAADAPPVGALRAWLDAGCHADMGWIGRGFEKRANPGLALSGARSVVVLGVNYGTGRGLMECGDLSPLWTAGLVTPPCAAGGLTSQPVKSGDKSPHSISGVAGAVGGAVGVLRWARFARFADYHDTIKAALARAGRVLEESLGITGDDYRYYVDTGPVLERAWAERAGVGFVGKNAMLISREFGNWLFLAAIFVRAEIAPDGALRANEEWRMKNVECAGTGVERAERGRVGLLCGKCTRCVDACPTGALAREGGGAGVVDSRLCVSYLTIENKGAIPRELREKIGARIFGCDVCAEVCPWNRFAQECRGVLLDARAGDVLARLSLRDVLTLTPGRFAAVFRGTVVKRIKLAGLLRNACVVAGNVCAPRANEECGMKNVVPSEARSLTCADAGVEVGAREVLGLLVELAAHESALVRAHAVWAVFRIVGRERAGELLRGARAGEGDAGVLREYEGGVW